jgi:hypothetical protein
VASLELKETRVLCGRDAQNKTHTKNIAVFVHPLRQIKVSSGKFNIVTTEAEITRLESELSFLQVKSIMTLQEIEVRHLGIGLVNRFVRQTKGRITAMWTCKERRSRAPVHVVVSCLHAHPYPPGVQLIRLAMGRTLHLP